MNIIKNNSELNEIVVKQHQTRVNTLENYNLNEVIKINSLDLSLFSKDFMLEEKDSDLYRSLSKLTNFRLLPGNQISSHRRIIGPIIVKAKKLIFPFLNIHLSKLVEGLNQFAMLVVYALANNHEKLSKLSK